MQYESTRHLVLYDGLCVLCNWFVRLVLRRDRERLFQFASLQSVLGRSLLTRRENDPHSLPTVVVVAELGTPDERLLARSEAVLFTLRALRWMRWVGNVLGVFPLPLLDWCYDIVAHHRYRVFGRYDACPVPPREYRQRFIEE